MLRDLKLLLKKYQLFYKYSNKLLNMKILQRFLKSMTLGFSPLANVKQRLGFSPKYLWL